MSSNPMKIMSPCGTRAMPRNPPATAARTSDLEVQNPRSAEDGIINTNTAKKRISRLHNNNNIFSLKNDCHIGVWNVRSLTDPGKLQQAALELQKLNLDIIGMSECRWNGYGEVTLMEGESFLYVMALAFV